MPTRIYSVEAFNSDDLHLVQAANRSSALRHVASNFYDVRIADQQTLVGALRAGIEVEVAGQHYEEPEI